MAIDPDLPRQRLEFMLAEADVPLLVSDRASAPGDIPGDVLCVEDLGVHGPDVCIHVSPETLCYVVYTSGTTGWPKGVAIEHGSLAAIVRDTAALLDRHDHVRVVQHTNLAFDPSALEVFLALATGGTLVHAGNALTHQPGGLENMIARHEAQVLIGVPSVTDMIDPHRTPSLRTLICGGEVLPARVVARWGSDRAIFNVYGPSEGTVFGVAHRCRDSDLGSPPIGRPLPGREVALIDDGLRPVGRGDLGEICLGGIGLARGYRRRPDLSRDHFVEIEGAYGCTRFYRTGDLGRMDEDGTLHFVGRADRQVKLRGFRIELEELERALTDISDVKEAAVVKVESPGAEKLLAYVVPALTGAVLGECAIREALADRLPRYMLPDGVHVLERLPRTLNGKVATEELPTPAESRPSDAPHRDGVGRRGLEALLLTLYREILEEPNLGPDAGLFDAGGDSLSVVAILSAASEAGVKITAAELYEHQTPAGVAAAVATRYDGRVGAG